MLLNAGVIASRATLLSDPYAADVVLFLKGDGSNGSTTILDSSPVPLTPTVIGNTQISTGQSKYGGSSIVFDGSGDYLSYANNADLAITGGDFTVEAWIYLVGYPNNNASSYVSTIIGKDTSGQRNWNMSLYGTPSSFTSLSFQGFVGGTSNLFTATHSFALNTWYHVAVSRSAGIIYGFVNGTLITSTAYAHTLSSTTSTSKIGALLFDGTYTYYLNGYIDSLRMTKGVARYTATFDPETDTYLNI